MTGNPADFGGQCLIGECAFEAELLMPSTTYFGLAKSGSHFYATLRDQHGNMRRVLRACDADQSMLSWLFVAEPGRQLERLARSEDMWHGPISITRDGDTPEFASRGTDPGQHFRFVHTSNGFGWDEAAILTLAGDSVGPAVQWFNTWDSGACFAVTAKYRVSGMYLGETVEGFAGHEIHYFTPGFNWLNAPYGRGREFCWQQIANEYDNGSMVQATFAYGAEGWGFAMVHDNGNFVSSTDVQVEATVRPNGYPQTLRYEFAGQSWTWRIDPQGERPALAGIAMLGADGICTRDGDTRAVRYSMGNSDWWTDRGADAIIKRG